MTEGTDAIVQMATIGPDGLCPEEFAMSLLAGLEPLESVLARRMGYWRRRASRRTRAGLAVAPVAV